MVFVTISKMDFRYGQGIEISKDTFEPWPGFTLYSFMIQIQLNQILVIMD